MFAMFIRMKLYLIHILYCYLNLFLNITSIKINSRVLNGMLHYSTAHCLARDLIFTNISEGCLVNFILVNASKYGKCQFCYHKFAF